MKVEAGAAYVDAKKVVELINFLKVRCVVGSGGFAVRVNRLASEM